MKDQKNLRRSAHARFNQARKHAKAAQAILKREPREITDGNMADLRDLAADFSQCVHEFNALRNALEWNGTEKRKAPMNVGFDGDEEYDG